MRSSGSARRPSGSWSDPGGPRDESKGRPAAPQRHPGDPDPRRDLDRAAADDGRAALPALEREFDTTTAWATWLLTAALYSNGYDAKLSVQPAAAINTINAALGWVPMLVALVMLGVILNMNIEKETKKMLEEKAAKAAQVPQLEV